MLAQHATSLRTQVGPSTLIELGAGNSSKTRHLLRAWTAGGQAAHYVPIDISAEMLQASCDALEAEFPNLAVAGLAGTYEQAFPGCASSRRWPCCFLGSSLGNLDRTETADAVRATSPMRWRPATT